MPEKACTTLVARHIESVEDAVSWANSLIVSLNERLPKTAQTEIKQFQFAPHLGGYAIILLLESPALYPTTEPE